MVLMKLEEHIHILRTLRIPFKANLTRILYHVFTEHKDEIKDIDEFIDKIMPKRKPRPQRETKAVISVGELVRKAQNEGLEVTGTRRQRPYRRRAPSAFYSEGDVT